MVEESVSGSPEPKNGSENAQRIQNIKKAEEALTKARDELAAREKDIREKALDLKSLTDGLIKREEELAARQRELARKEDELLKNSPSAAAAAIESRTRALDDREKKLSSDARNLKVFAEQLMKREEEYNIRVKSFNEEAEAELRGRVEELARREKEAVKRDQEATARAQQTGDREQELAKREKAASDRLQDALRREEDLKIKAQELARREDEMEMRIKEAVRHEQAATEAEQTGARPGEVDKRGKELEELQSKLMLKETELKSRTAQFAAHEEQLRAMEDELKRREEEWKVFSTQATAKDRELKAMDEELRKKEQELQARSSAQKAKEEELTSKGAMALEKAVLDDKTVEIDAKTEEVRIRGKELKIRHDELDRREVAIKEREDRMARLFSGAGAAGPPLSEEDRLRIMNEMAAREQDFERKQEDARAATRSAIDQLDARQMELSEREAKLQSEAENLKSLAANYLQREQEIGSREDKLAAALEALAGKEELVKELDERTRMLTDRERAVEQFNQELLALDAMLQKKAEEQAGTEKLFIDRGEALEREADGLEAEKEQLSRDIEAHAAEKEALRAKSAELEKAQKEIAEKDAAIKSEEEKLALLSAEVTKNMEEIQSLEKDLKYKEIHLLTLEEEIKDCPYCSAKDGFVTTMQAIAEAKALGADVTDAERLFKQAGIALDTSSYEGAVQYNRKAMVLAREAKQKYLVHGVSYILAGARRAVQAAAKMGVDVTDAEAMLATANNALERKDYENAEQLARKAERAAILAEDKARELADRLERTGKRMEEISAYGVDLGEAQAAVQAARDLLKDKKQNDARMALEGVEEMAFLAFRRQATKLMDDAREAVASNKASGADLGDAELFLAKAEERLAEGDYGKSIQCSREAFRFASEARPPSAEALAGADGQGAPGAGRRSRTRPRVVASTVRILTPGTGNASQPMMAAGAVMPQAPGGPRATVQMPAGGPQTSGAITQGLMDRSPRGIPLQIPPGGGVPKDYQCPTCHGYFTVEDPRRPVITKCPSCTTLVRLT